MAPAGQSLNLQFFDDSKNCAINFRPKNVGFFEVSGLVSRYYFVVFKNIWDIIDILRKLTKVSERNDQEEEHTYTLTQVTQ